MEKSYSSRFFRYTVKKKGQYYVLNVRKIFIGQVIDPGRNLTFTYDRLYDFLNDLGLPYEFINSILC